VKIAKKIGARAILAHVKRRRHVIAVESKWKSAMIVGKIVVVVSLALASKWSCLGL